MENTPDKPEVNKEEIVIKAKDLFLDPAKRLCEVNRVGITTLILRFIKLDEEGNLLRSSSDPIKPTTINHLQENYTFIKNKRTKEWRQARAHNTKLPIQKMVYDSLSVLFPEERVEAKENGYGILKIVIHYPEIQITDGTYSHIMRDLFVKLEIDIASEKLIDGIRVTRRTVNSKENSSGYYFSHATEYSSTRMDWRETCLGGGTSISVTVAELKRGFSQRKFEALLVMLDNYLSWESREGVPFFYIKESAIETPRPPQVSHMRVDWRELEDLISKEEIWQLILPSKDVLVQWGTDMVRGDFGGLFLAPAEIKRIANSLNLKENHPSLVEWKQAEGVWGNEIIQPSNNPTNRDVKPLQFRDKVFNYTVKPEVKQEKPELLREEWRPIPSFDERINNRITSAVIPILKELALTNQYHKKYYEYYKQQATGENRIKARKAGNQQRVAISN